MQPPVADADLPLPEAYLEFIARFNRGEFWESHEVLEGPWREHRSPFYKGMILFASAFVHVQRGNPRGVLAQLRKAERVLGPFQPSYLGMDVAALLAHAERCRSGVGSAANPAAGWAERIAAPQLRPDPARVRGDEAELNG